MYDLYLIFKYVLVTHMYKYGLYTQPIWTSDMLEIEGEVSDGGRVREEMSFIHSTYDL